MLWRVRCSSEPKISGPETLLNLSVAIDEDLTTLHPQLQIVLSDVRMVLLVKDESTFSFSPDDGETDGFPISVTME
jgi:hypothetical protein